MANSYSSYIRCDSTYPTLSVNTQRLWCKWNHDYTTASSTTDTYYDVNNPEITTSSSTTWTEWNKYQPTVYIQNNHVWENWVVVKRDAFSVRLERREPRQRTEEELARAAAAAEAAAQRRAEVEAAMAAAQERAHTLLLSALDEEQAAEYTERRHGRRYCIKHGRQDNVFLVDDDGRLITEYCGHVGESVPDEDNILAQKLILEHDEDAFIRVANARSVAVPARRQPAPV